MNYTNYFRYRQTNQHIKEFPSHSAVVNNASLENPSYILYEIIHLLYVEERWLQSDFWSVRKQKFKILKV